MVACPITNSESAFLILIKAMTTKTFEIEGLFGALDHLAVKKRLERFPGVSSVEVNAASTTASITYDKNTTTPEHLIRAIKECGFHCTGVALPAHVCTPGVPGEMPPASSNATLFLEDHEVSPDSPPQILRCRWR